MTLCAARPTWARRPGLLVADSIGNGIGVLLEWEPATPTSPTNNIYYNIYYSDTRFGVFTEGPKAITSELNAVVNIIAGNIQYMAVRATEFSTPIDITELEQTSTNTYKYPTDRTLTQITPIVDGYEVEISDTTGFPSVGEILIGTEVMGYTDIDYNTDTLTVLNDDREIYGEAGVYNSGDSVSLWPGIEDNNSIIVQGVAAWSDSFGTPQKDSAIGEYNADLDGYRVQDQDNLTTDLSTSDADSADFPNYDYCGLHRPSLQETFSGQCVGSYLGGSFNGSRGLDIQERNLARLDAQLQLTGESVVLLRRKWTGRRCSCVGLRREHPRSRCSNCYGTGFAGGFDRYVNPRAVSEFETNTNGFIKVRIPPYTDNLAMSSNQGLQQDVLITGCWSINFPSFKDRDLITRFIKEGNIYREEFRYEIQDVTRNILFFGESGKQEFKILRLDKTDEIYKFPITLT